MALLSIITPIYNAEKTLQRTIDSIDSIHRENQSKLEVIFINDGSTDGSKAIVERLIASSPGYKAVLINQKNAGSAVARNEGLKKASGEWIFFLDADDELCLDLISRAEEYPEHSALAFTVRLWKQEKIVGQFKAQSINPATRMDVFTSKNPFQPSCLLFKKAAVKTLFNPEFSFLEDWLFWTMNPDIFRQILAFPDIISAKIHIHGENKTGHYEKNGLFRERVAEEIISSYQDGLSKKQKNNLLIQKYIGKIQQGEKISLAAFCAFPCGLVLYLKLVVYFVFAKTGRAVGPYSPALL
ncbi:MAG: glycosyltransferase [Spirochaetota bacterium]|nr:glycosyltransferase [Spirochaetota bacterium]